MGIYKFFLCLISVCMSISVDIIKPCGFIFSDRRLKRAGMNYLDSADITQHDSWGTFREFVTKQNKRLILLSTRAEAVYTNFSFKKNWL